jgi:hypothetical protein
LVLLGVLISSTAAAVTPRVGVIAGFNFADLNIDGQSGMDIRSSFAGGGVLDLGLNDRFGIRVEPTFLSKGGKATKRNAYWGTVDGAVFKLDYIDLPVLARVDLAATDTRGYLLAGLGVSFATQSEVELTQGNTTGTADLGDVFKPTDVSVNLGLGVSFRAGTNRAGIDGRVAFGVTDINEGGTITFNGAPLTVPQTSTKTLDFRLFATYLFSL